MTWKEFEEAGAHVEEVEVGISCAAEPAFRRS